MTTAWISGFECGDTNEWSDLQVGTRWTNTVSTAYNRTTGGNYGMRCVRDALSGGTVGSYVSGQNALPVWYNDPAGASPGGITLPLSFRFYFYIDTWNGTSPTHSESILEFTFTDASGTGSVAMIISGGRLLRIKDRNGTFLTIYTPALDTWYRCEGFITKSTVEADIYAEAGTTSLGHGSQATGFSSDPGSASDVYFGCKTIFGQNAITDIWFDDLKINENTSTYPGRGAWMPLVYPDTDSTPIDFNCSTGTDHSVLVDDSVVNDWAVAAPTDYVTTPVGGTNDLEDRYTLAATTAPNGTICVAIMAWSNAADASVIGANHRLGGTDGTNRYEGPAFNAGTATYQRRGIILSTQPDGSAWDDTGYGALEVFVRRVGENVSSRNVSSMAIFIEDDDGGTPPVAPSVQRARGSVT